MELDLISVSSILCTYLQPQVVFASPLPRRAGCSGSYWTAANSNMSTLLNVSPYFYFYVYRKFVEHVFLELDLKSILCT